MMEAFWRQDAEEASRMVSELLWRTISYNDYHEDYYHAFLAGVFVGIGYEVESNREKGLGRPDILLKDEDGLYGHEQIFCYGIAFFKSRQRRSCSVIDYWKGID